MKRSLFAVALVCLSLFTTGAVRAHDAKGPRAVRVGEVLGIFAAAELGGGLAGGAAGVGTMFLMLDSEDDFDESWGVSLGVGSIAGSFGGAAAANWAGDAMGYNGSYWGAFAGGLVGSAASIGIFYLADENVDALAAFLVLPATGITLGYLLSQDDDGDEPRSASLVSLDQGTLQMGVPAVAVSREGDGMRVDALVFDARW